MNDSNLPQKLNNKKGEIKMEYVSAKISKVGVTPSIKGKQNFCFTTRGLWSGKLAVEVLQNDESWKTARVFSSNNDANYDFGHNFLEEETIRINAYEFNGGTCDLEMQFALI